MARKTLAALVDAELNQDSESPVLREVGTAVVQDPDSSEADDFGPSGLPAFGTLGLPDTDSSILRSPASSGLAASGTPGLPKYLRLARKEARLSEDQVDALTELARRLERRKPKGVGERITENTLIRIGVELLLRHANRLEGHTEEELLRSVHH